MQLCTEGICGMTPANTCSDVTTLEVNVTNFYCAITEKNASYFFILIWPEQVKLLLPSLFSITFTRLHHFGEIPSCPGHMIVASF